MIRLLVNRAIGKMERAFNYDASYLREMLNTSPPTFKRFSALTRLVDRRACPAPAIAAATLAATLQEDCGPCTQISLDMAAAGGVDPSVLRAILADDHLAMGADASLGLRFARASLARDMEIADPLRDEIVARWGDKGLLALSMAIVTGRMYPTVKYALGHGKACSRLTVAGTPVVDRAKAA